MKQVYFGAVCVELKWFGFRDKSKELKKELGELRKTHDAVMMENTALVAEMAKKDSMQTQLLGDLETAQTQQAGSAPEFEADLEAKLTAANSEIAYLTDKIEIMEQNNKKARASFDKTTNPLCDDAVSLTAPAYFCC